MTAKENAANEVCTIDRQQPVAAAQVRAPHKKSAAADHALGWFLRNPKTPKNRWVFADSASELATLTRVLGSQHIFEGDFTCLVE